MATVTLKLEGFGQLQRALAEAPERVRVRASHVVGRSTSVIEQRARSLVPIATGLLAGSITSSHSGLVGGVGISGTDAYYWRFVEFGTVSAGAQPFFRPAAELERNAFIERMRQIGPQIEQDLREGRIR